MADTCDLKDADDEKKSEEEFDLKDHMRGARIKDVVTQYFFLLKIIS